MVNDDRSLPKNIHSHMSNDGSDSTQEESNQEESSNQKAFPEGSASTGSSQEKTTEVICPFCQSRFKRTNLRQKRKPLIYCAYCGARLTPSEQDYVKLAQHGIVEAPPKKELILFQIGQYQILKSIGKGGMGEVFLAYDQVAGRRVALKKIRSEYIDSLRLRGRFLREARISSQLTHPSIMPIYDLHEEGNSLYYTMPFVEGKTLRQILDIAKKHDEGSSGKNSENSLPSLTSIPALMRTFSSVVQAVAYAHSKGVLHRDLKPENIMVGKYGEVIILDWGLTKVIDEEENDNIEDLPESYAKRSTILTKIGKVVGTIAYMAPERALKLPATIQTDIYALGVILYQILTLTMPFHRKSIDEFNVLHHKEQLIPPEIRAPYRDVPPILSEIVKKCLAKDPESRYKGCDQLLSHIESYLEGRSEWFPVKALFVNQKDDWEFQEHILIAEHTAITHGVEISDWVSLMISKDSFAENVMIECSVTLGKDSQGIGLLVSIPEAIDRIHMTEGFCLWLASERSTSKTRLMRSSITVVEDDNCLLKSHKAYEIRMEKIGNHLSIYIDNELSMRYTSYIPTVGTRVGLLSKDGDFNLHNGLKVYIGSESVTVSCLAVPDAFLASRDFNRALSEYHRIGKAFTGHAEGREALFRVGVTYLEQAKSTSDLHERDELINSASKEFETLRGSPGAPLEYLGKALIYEAEGDYVEEAKCFELAFRKYPRHPLLPILAEQIVLRMHETTRLNRVAAYHFILIASRYLPRLSSKSWFLGIFESLNKHWEEPPFFLSKNLEGNAERHAFTIKLAFWLARPIMIRECISHLVKEPVIPIGLIFDALSLLTLMGEDHLHKEALDEIKQQLSIREQEKNSELFSLNEALDSGNFDITQKAISREFERALFLHLKKSPQEPLVLKISQFLLNHCSLFSEEFIEFIIQQLLEISSFDLALEILEKKVGKEEVDESSKLFFVQGCLFAFFRGETAALFHFSKLFDSNFPRTHLLGAHFINSSLSLRSDHWISQSFWWEQKELLRQLELFKKAVPESDYYEKASTLISKT